MANAIPQPDPDVRPTDPGTDPNAPTVV